jgi:drug/metabolite transporter (DMT)-like permease
LRTVTISAEARVVDSRKRRQAVLIILCCTLLVAVAQLLIKTGANRLGGHPDVMATLVGIFTIPPLFAGYCLYGIFAVLMVYALRHGELSVLYPLISLGYVWVAILSLLVFHETMNAMKLAGIAIIVTGVAILGWGGRN